MVVLCKLFIIVTLYMALYRINAQCRYEENEMNSIEVCAKKHHSSSSCGILFSVQAQKIELHYFLCSSMHITKDQEHKIADK